MKSKILIVDDEPDVIFFVKKQLEAHGYEVSAASDGAAGLQKAFEEAPDLILLDVVMPHRDGFSVLHELQSAEKTKHIPVIMLTAKAESTAVFQGQELGAADYIIKPFDVQVLLKFIKKYTV
ncbi:MAG: response regulator [Candidatus Omnitrophota bacterium]|jgi:DNA-binding response OmpR family regulator